MAPKSGLKLDAGAVSDFSAGPNFRDSPSELARNEDYGSYNCTYDERGGAASRLGSKQRNATALGGVGDLVINDVYSQLLGKWITQSGKSLYLDDVDVAVHTFTTSDCVTFCETDNKVIAAHPVDGLWQSADGSTWTQITGANVPTAPLCIAVWEAKLWVGLADGTVHWSAAGDPTSWAALDFNPIWTKDQAPIVNLHVGSGQDIQGRPGLLVFKNESVYRINDPATGAYTVIDYSSGAAGPKAVIGVGARVCWIGKRGLFWWREDQAQPVSASDRLAPVWRPEQLSDANQELWCAGRRLNRALFSCSTVNSSVNDLAFEFHPDQGWVAPRSDAMSCYATSTGAGEITCGGSPTVDGQVWQLDSGGKDGAAADGTGGTAITGWFQMRWVVLNGGFQAQLWLVRIHGRGSGTVYVRADYEDGDEVGTSTPFDLNPATGTWDDGTVWDDGADWEPTTLQQTQEFDDLGTCRQFSLRFEFTVSGTGAGRQLFGTAPAPIVGEFGLFGLEYLYVPLGLS